LFSIANEVHKRESKGGIGFELILENPTCEMPAKVMSPSRVISVEDIESKLKAAEERRKQLEDQKLSSIKEKEVKGFEPPTQKITIADIESKLKAAEDRRLSLEAQKVLQLREKDSKGFEPPQRKLSTEEIESKLKAAEERRKSLEMQKIMSLKEHDAKVLDVRSKRSDIKSQVTGDQV